MHSVNEYRRENLETKDKSLEYILSSVDSTLTDFNHRYEEELKYVVERKGFVQAEETWIQTGEAEALLERMKENLLTDDSMIESVVAIFRGRLILSTNGKMDYWLPVHEEKDDILSTVVCSDENMNPYIAFIYYKNDITYAAIINPVLYYSKIEETSGLKSIGDMILMDKVHFMFMYRNEDSVVANLLADEGDIDNRLLRILYNAKDKQTESIDFYEVKEGPYKEAYRARVAICPYAVTKNGIFSIGILHNEDQQLLAMNTTIIKTVLCAGMIVLCIMLLIFYLFWIYRQDARNRKEITILRAKKETLEAINEQTKEMAHHQRLETIGQLTSGVAHEFNNLLTPIMGYSLMIMEHLPENDTESYDNLLEIYQASQKAKALISRLSDLSRKNSAVSMGNISPNIIVTEAVSMAMTSKPIYIDLETDLQCIGVMLYGNKAQLSHMFLNLILNAYHAIEDRMLEEEDFVGNVIIRNYVEDDQIIYTVSDNGTGMSKEIQKKIFDPFFTTKMKGRGTGLGLAIVMQTVEEHKGKITVESKVGEGSTFLLSFPLAEVEVSKDTDTKDEI